MKNLAMPRYLLLLFLFPMMILGQKDTTKRLSAVSVIQAKTRAISLPPDWPPLKTPEIPIQLSTTQNLNFAPGMAAFEGTAGTAKFSYRGMGARTQYSTSRSLVYLGEVPITSIQGFSSFEDLNPLWVPHLSLIAEPGRSFPLALGGVLKYDPQWRFMGIDRRDSTALLTQLNLGSFGLVQSNNMAFKSFENSTILAGYENTSQTGWRENNELQRQSLFLNANWALKGAGHLQLIGYGIKNRVEIPSSLSRDDFLENPDRAAESWGRTKGYKAYDRLITGITYSGGKAWGLNYKVTAFYRYLDNFEPRPFNILTEKRHSGGLRFRMQKDSLELGKAQSTLYAFGEYQIGNEAAATFENRFDSSDNSYNNIGANLNENEILGQRMNGGLTMQTEFKDSRKDKNYWALQTGVNAFYQYNQVQSAAEQNYSVPFILAPLVNLKYVVESNNTFIPKLAIYRNFSVPSLEENLDPDGSLNRDLKPELAWTGEFGFDWKLSSLKDLNLDLNYYYSWVDNLIVPRLIGPDQVIATNSGSSQHTGLEFQLANPSYVAYPQNWHPHFIISGYYGSFSYIEFSDTAGSFSGNRLPGFPDWQVNASVELKYDNQNDLSSASLENRENHFRCSLGLLGRYTSGYFINDENTVETEPYFILQSWLRAEREFGKHFTASANLGVRNITDTHYASMTVVNNRAFGGGSPRFFYPGEPINWFGGLSFSYHW